MGTIFKYLTDRGVEYVVSAENPEMKFAIVKCEDPEVWSAMKERLAGRFISSDDFRIGLNCSPAIAPYNPYPNIATNGSNWDVLDEAAKALDWLYRFWNIDENIEFQKYKV